MELELEGKAALVTGGSRGIGRAVAQALSRHGVRLFLVARGEAALEASRAELAASGAVVQAGAFDVSTREGAEGAVHAAVKALGGLELLVNNVGGSLGTGAFDTVGAEKFEEVVRLNLLSAVWCSQPAVAWMKDHGGGAIVNIGSIFGREYATSAPYTAAKAALTALTKEMAVDLARYRIRVNQVAPGSILFPGGSWDRRQRADPALIERMVKEQLPFGRFGTPEEVAQAVVFLCSPRASWVSGACLPVDGAQGRAF